MNWVKTAVTAALLTAAAAPAFAQQPDSARRAPRPGRVERPRAERFERGPQGPRPGFGNVEAALRMRQQLKLTDAQVGQLESLRKQLVTQRQNEAREMIELRSRIAAGNLDRDEARKQLEARRESMRTTMEQRRQQLEKLLTPEQRDELRRVQGMQARRMQMRAPRGPRGQPGMRPGVGNRGVDQSFRDPQRSRLRF